MSLHDHERSNQDMSAGSGAVRPDRYAKKALWASTIGYAMDGFDLLILSFALPAITATFSLSSGAAGSIATITLIGAVVGGFLGGMLSDYLGRVRLLTYSIIVFALFTLLTGLAPTFGLLALFRFLSGVGIGAEYGVGMTLVAETWPAKIRARGTSYVGLGWQAGVLLAAVVSGAMLPIIGWRGLFMLGAVPAIVAIITRLTVGEPQAYLERGARKQKTFPLKELVRGRTAIKYTVAIIVLTSVQNFGYYGVITWLPSYLSDRFGYGLTQSTTWTVVTIIGMGFGIFVFGRLADRFGRRPIMVIFQACAALSVFGYSWLSGEYALLIGGAVMGMFVNGMLGGYGAITAELFPTHARSTAQNVLWNIGRAVGGFGPAVIGVLIAAYSFRIAVGLLSLIYILDIIVTVFLLRESKGSNLIEQDT